MGRFIEIVEPKPSEWHGKPILDRDGNLIGRVVDARLTDRGVECTAYLSAEELEAACRLYTIPRRVFVGIPDNVTVTGAMNLPNRVTNDPPADEPTVVEGK